MQKPYTVPLDVPLPYPEDQNLTYMTKVEEVEIYRPPGIHSLRQWGQMKLPEGKHKGKSFLETVEKDYQYAQWIDKNKSLTSDWARSFQGFVRAWNQMTMNTVQGVSTPCPMAKGKVSGKKTPGDDWSEAEEELILVQETGRSGGKLPTSGKRGYPIEKTEGMEMEVNAELVAQLQCQIAVLQRELAKVTNQASTSSVPQ